MEDLTELRQRLRTQRPVAWEQLPDFALCIWTRCSATWTVR